MIVLSPPVIPHARFVNSSDRARPRSQNATLEELNMRSNQLGALDSAAVSRALGANAALRLLDLQFHRFGRGWETAVRASAAARETAFELRV